MKIAVIMSTYNGEKYLAEQIDSILNQQNIEIELFIRDDGSKDNTRAILKQYSNERENVHIECGENLGFAKSFISMLRDAGDYDYYAFSDQDDFWEKNKLAAAIEKLEETIGGSQKPVLYYSNLNVSNANLEVLKRTKLEKRKRTLESTFMRRSVAGCTMVLNKRLKQLLYEKTLSDEVLVRGHDSFIHSLCYSVKSEVVVDENAYIKYRQHTDNTSGSSDGVIKRVKKEVRDISRHRGGESILASEIIKNWKIAEEEKNVLEVISNSQKNILARFKIFFSPAYVTGDIRLTILGKVKYLFGIM